MDIKLGQNPLINSGYKYMLLYHPDHLTMAVLGLHRPAADAQRSAPAERGPVHGAPLAHGAGHRHRGGGHTQLYICIISLKAAFIYIMFL